MTTNTRTRVLARLISALLGTAAVAVGGTMLAAPSNAVGSYGPYRTVASPSLNERSAPLSTAAVVGALPYYSTIYVACQTSGSLVGHSTVWDKLTNGAYISDYWTNTPGINTWTTSIPRCKMAPVTAATGRTASYNEGAGGQCTWWAIDQFQAFSGLYPNLIMSNHNDAQYWAGNASYNGWTVVSTPRVDSIAVFPRFTNGAGYVGHVAWVTAVGAGTITVSEMDFPTPWRTDNRTLAPASSVRYILAP